MIHSLFRDKDIVAIVLPARKHTWLNLLSRFAIKINGWVPPPKSKCTHLFPTPLHKCTMYSYNSNTHTSTLNCGSLLVYLLKSYIYATLIAPKLKLTAVAVNCATILRNSQRQCQIQFLYQWSGMLLPHKLENKSLQFNC